MESLKSDGYCMRLLNGLKDLQINDQLCDITLIAGDNLIRAHRAVLAASSDYFRALLTADMKEKGQAEIQLKGVPGEGLKEIVQFIYTGNLNCTLGNIDDILKTASYVQQTDALNLCCHYLVNITTPQNSVDMFNTAEQFHLPALKDKAVSLILAHFEDIASRNDYISFSPTFLAELLADNRLKMFSELKLFKIVLNWIHHEESTRSSHLFSLMSRVRFPLFTSTELVTEVMVESRMKTDPKCLELLLEAMSYHLVPQNQPQLQNERTQLRNNVASLILLDVEEEGPRTYNLGSLTWSTLPSAKVQTIHSQVTVLDNFMYICGGIELSSNNPVSGRCYRYDPRFDNCTEIAALQEPRHHFAFVPNGKTLYAIGGYCNGVFKNVVEQYLVNENKWRSRSPVEIRVSAAAAASLNGYIYLTGGQTDRGASRSVFSYDPVKDQWQEKMPLLQARMEHAMCAFENKLYVFGGYSKNIIRAYDVNTVEAYNVDTAQWTVVVENTPKISGIHCCLVDTDIYIAAGFTYDENKKTRDVWTFSLTKNEWRTVARLSTPVMAIPICALYLKPMSPGGKA